MRCVLAALLIAALMPPAARAQTPGEFDYYVLALSWSPNWCARDGDPGEAQCAPGSGRGWVVHGLWPQYEDGWPEFCTVPRSLDPTRAESADIADVFGNAGLAWYQWRKHGRCSGLSGPDYYALTREAYGSVTRPEVLRQLDRPIVVPAEVIEEAWLQVNPGLSDAGLRLTCADGMIAEARICLARDLTPRACATDASRDCTLDRARLEPLR